MSYKTNLKGRLAKREILRKQLDEFATFYWGNTDMFEEYGAFIINESKGSLKFYNGPQFTNQYGQTQWGESNYFTGVKFSTVKIDFTIGLYGFTIEEYQRFLHEFNPYRIDNLRFSFNPNWRYLVKPTQIPSSSRYIIGQEGGEPYYYTEIKMTFEIQGIPCARHINSYEIKQTETANLNEKTFKLNTHDVESFLETPLNFDCSLTPGDSDFYSVSLWVGDKNNNMELFTIIFNPLVLAPYINPSLQEKKEKTIYSYLFPINLSYRSEEGVLLYAMGNTEENTYLLNLQSAINGNRLIHSIVCNKFVLPGKGNFPNVNIADLRFTLEVNGFILDNDTSNKDNLDKDNFTMSLSSFPRINVI